MAAPQPHQQAQRKEEENPYDQRVLNIDRVARVVKGGRRFRFRALVCLGDGKGNVGIATAKGTDVTSAITKAADAAKKNMVKIHLKGTTIPHDVMGKRSGAKIMIKPAADGTGLIAGSVAREILDCIGIKNIVTKSLGNSNKMNVSYAVLDALSQLVPQKDWVTTKNRAAKQAPKEAKVEAK